MVAFSVPGDLPRGPDSHHLPPAAAPRARFGPYRLVQLLGRGTMGVVYRARHVDSGEEVALKVGDTISENALGAIRREIHALKQLRHPGVVRVVADGVEAGVPWLAMELLAGASVRRFIDDLHGRRADAVAAGGALEDALLLVARLCEPLAYVHGRGIVHGDLKPENVHLREDGLPVLVDFGLFAPYGGTTSREVLQVAGSLTGTVSYMAPEQIRGQLIDARADLYALGCIAYEAITGVPPFSSGTAGEVLLAHLFASPKPPSARVGGVPRWVDELVLGLLSKTRRERLGYADIVARRIAAELGVSLGTPLPPIARSYLYRPEFVGRDEVLGTIVGDLEAARKGGGTLVFVHGESGIGKTRLAIEIGSAAVERGLTVLLGECVTFASERNDAPRTGAALQAFHPVLNAIADRCRRGGRSETDRLLGAGGTVLASFEPSFATLPGQDAYAAPPELSPEAAVERLQRVMVEALKALATPEAPLLLILDDLQWADELSLAVLAAVDRRGLEGSPVVIVGTYRTEEVNEILRPIVERPRARVFRLERLGGEGIRRIVGDMLALPDVRPDFVGALFGQAEGNPFFVSEYLHAAVDEHLLLRDGAGKWTIASPATAAEPLGYALPIPRSLDALIRHRLDVLDPAARGMIELASVLGQSFEEELLMTTTVLPQEQAMDILDLLLRRGLLERTERTVVFTHGNIHEIAYHRLAAADRAVLHERVARSIEERCGDAESATRHAAVLAHHWTRAASGPHPDSEVVTRALAALTRAGEQAVRADASHDAVRLFEDALALFERAGAPQSGADRRARWEHQLGEAYYRLGKAVDARRHLEAALRLMGERPPRGRIGVAWRLSAGAARQLVRRLAGRVAREPLERESRTHTAARAYELLSFVQLLMMDRTRALASNLRALNLAELGPPSAVLANSMALLGVSAGMLLGPRVARPYLRRALETARELGDDYCLGRVAHMVAFHCMGQAMWNDAVRACEEARAAFERVHDGRWRETAVLTLANALHLRGDIASLEHYRAAGAASRERGDLQSQAWAAVGLADAHLLRGDAAGALASLDAFEEILGGDVARIADRTTEFSVCGIRAAAFLRAHRNEEADREVQAALVTAERSSLLLYHAISGYRRVCEVAVRRWEMATLAGNRSEASFHEYVARRATGLLRRWSYVFASGRPQAAIWDGTVAWLEGHGTRARAAWTRALELARRYDMPLELAMAHHELGRHAPRDEETRRRHLEHACELFESLGARYELASAQRELARNREGSRAVS